MGCGCKSKKKKNESGDVVIETNVMDKILLIGRLTLMSILVTVLMPVVWFILLKMVYKSNFGGEFDVTEMITKLLGNKKETTEEEKPDVNPEDLELVDVDKIK
jgi:hypothetical protein